METESTRAISEVKQELRLREWSEQIWSEQIRATAFTFGN